MADTEVNGHEEVPEKTEAVKGETHAPKKEKKKRRNKAKTEESEAPAADGEHSDGEKTPRKVGPSHDKDIPGLVNSFEACIMKASKKSKHGCPEDIHINRFIEAFQELLPVLRLLGTAFYFVEQDIVEKLNSIKSNQDAQKDTDHSRTILDFVHWEKETKGDALRKDKHSTARQTLRLMRALHFIHLFLDKLNDPKMEPKPAAKEAYEVSLHKYHSWSVRTAVSVAFYTLPYRKTFLHALSMDPAEADVFADFVRVSGHIRQILNAYYDANDWQNLP